MNRDPIEEGGGINLFESCINSPIEVVDPFGFEGGTSVISPGSGIDQGLPRVPDLGTTAAEDAAATSDALGTGAAGGGALLGGVIVGAAIDVGLIAYDMHLINQINNLNNQMQQQQQQLSQQERREKDYNAYKKRCDEPPPPGLDPCELAKWKLQRVKDCQRMRVDFANNYDDWAHQMGEIGALARAIQNAMEEVDKACKPCPKNNQ